MQPIRLPVPSRAALVRSTQRQCVRQQSGRREHRRVEKTDDEQQPESLSRDKAQCHCSRRSRADRQNESQRVQSIGDSARNRPGDQADRHGEGQRQSYLFRREAARASSSNSPAGA